MSEPAETSGAQSSSERRASEARHRDSRSYSPFVPIVAIGVAIFVWLVFQTALLVRESNLLSTARDNQDVQTKAAEKMRQALDAVARDTAKLSARGNANARIIVDELRKRGVTINPDAPPPTPASTGK